VLPFLTRARIIPDPTPEDIRQKVTHVVTDAAHRLVVAGDILDYAHFFSPDESLQFDDKSVDKVLRKPGAPELLAKLRELVATTDPFDSTTLKQRIEELARAENVKPGPVSQILRVGVTGKEVGFGAYETLVILGKEHSLARLDRALGLLQSGT
jgi:glutamyl/glutaminyl-tRNA synthetase